MYKMRTLGPSSPPEFFKICDSSKLVDQQWQTNDKTNCYLVDPDEHLFYISFKFSVFVCFLRDTGGGWIKEGL